MAFARAEVENARAVIERVERAVQEHEEMSMDTREQVWNKTTYNVNIDTTLFPNVKLSGGCEVLVPFFVLQTLVSLPILVTVHSLPGRSHLP